MSAMISFGDRPLAAALGLIGLVLLAGWPLFSTRRAVLAAQFGIGAAFVGHYLLLEAWTGVAVTAVGAAQSLFALSAQDHPALRRIGWTFLALPAVIAWTTWGGVHTLLATIALTLMMLGRMQRNEVHLRLVLLAATPFGMAHDFIIGSLPAFAGGALAFVLGGLVLLRHRAGRQWPKRPLPVRLATAPSHRLRLSRHHREPTQWSPNHVACR